jgi:DNA-binding transcriptional MerR regulator
MQYTIKQFSDMTGLSGPTLRYYESEGVLPFVSRDSNGNRRYDEGNVKWVDFILALRDTGMGVVNIRRYVDLYKQGNSTMRERKEMLLAHRRVVRNQLREMRRHLDKIDYKLSLYEQLEADPTRTDIVI